MTDTELIPINQDITPVEFKKVHANLAKFVKDQLREAKNIDKGGSGDYGIIPFTKKKSLLKPGAEKLLKLFGFSGKNELIDKVEDWQNRFIYYRYKCTITHIVSGKFIADATRTCNNKERKHASKDVFDVANTIESVAQKRALVAATVQATMASEIFDADVSDHDDEAPNTPVKKDEDPRRVRVFGAYFSAATDRGFTQDQAKTAAHRKLNIKSLTEATTKQIEDLTAELIKTFAFVGDGNKPEKFTPSHGATRVLDITEGTVVGSSIQESLPSSMPEHTRNQKEEIILRICPNPRENPDCQKTIPDDYPHDICSACRMKEFIISGKLSKGVKKPEQTTI